MTLEDYIVEKFDPPKGQSLNDADFKRLTSLLNDFEDKDFMKAIGLLMIETLRRKENNESPPCNFDMFIESIVFPYHVSRIEKICRSMTEIKAVFDGFLQELHDWEKLGWEKDLLPSKWNF